MDCGVPTCHAGCPLGNRIPDFKLEKQILDRRLGLMAKEGIRFEAGVHIGVDLSAQTLTKEADAVVICTGAARPRDLAIDGRDLAGIHQAMPFLKGQNQVLAGELEQTPISAHGLEVVVIGGGDTGSDCIGTCLRQGAASVTNFELLPRPGEDRPESAPWPYWPMRLRTSNSHEEGGERRWAIRSKRFIGDAGRVRAVETVSLRWNEEKGRPTRFEEIPDSEKSWPADLVILAMGFAGPETDTGTLVAQLGLELDEQGHIRTQDHRTSAP
jgi:glutamate synthase (NADPH/NADH) small chain